jgi:ornithine carbamoyltransferase
MQQVHGSMAGQTVAYVGDYNNVSRSLAEACLLLGANVSLGCPVGYHADDAELERLTLLARGNAIVRQVHQPADAVVGSIAVHTDTWTSMGQEAEKQARQKAFEGYTVDAAMMARALPGAGFYHCLPAYRGLEVAAEVIDGPSSHVFPQAHNRMHAARGALAFLMGVR